MHPIAMGSKYFSKNKTIEFFLKQQTIYNNRRWDDTDIYRTNTHSINHNLYHTTIHHRYP